jgi:hypothetical protein
VATGALLAPQRYPLLPLLLLLPPPLLLPLLLMMLLGSARGLLAHGGVAAPATQEGPQPWQEAAPVSP